MGQLDCFVSARTDRAQSATATITTKPSITPSKYYKHLDIHEDSVEFGTPCWSYRQLFGTAERFDAGLLAARSLRSGDAMMFQMGNVAHTIDPRQTAVFQLSGGPTGLPKVAPRLHEEYNYNALPGRRRSAGDREPLPIMHNAGISLALVAR